ncbi:MAG: 4'-phosphopantetheinyl transferase superfamily protein [Prevotella sp.]|nr:4'-phosphopantetheinyl transferase superfamily protein [Prevotella sp.]
MSENIFCRVIVRDVERLADEAAFRQQLPRVSVERQQKALRFKFPMGRALSLGAALVLDELLQVHGLWEREQHYIIGEHGKPSLAAHPELHFSLSHSGHYVACALSSAEVGIDIQHRVKVNEGVVRRVCSEEEIDWLDALDKDDRGAGFLRLWTLKESWFKAVGTGLTDDYPYFDLTGSFPRLLNKEGIFHFYEFSFAEGRGAVCIPAVDIRPEIVVI